MKIVPRPKLNTLRLATQTESPRLFVVHKKVVENLFLIKGSVKTVPSMLGFTCVMNGQSMDDYIILSVVDDPEIRKQTQEIIDAGSELQRRAAQAIRLTKREQEVLCGVSDCKSNKEIAASLNLSVRTIKFHVSSLLLKFNVSGRAYLAQKSRKLLIWKRVDHE